MIDILTKKGGCFRIFFIVWINKIVCFASAYYCSTQSSKSKSLSEFFKANQIFKKKKKSIERNHKIRRIPTINPRSTVSRLDLEAPSSSMPKKPIPFPLVSPLFFLPPRIFLLPPHCSTFSTLSTQLSSFLFSLPTPSEGGKRTVLLAASTKDLFPADATRADNITVGNREGGEGEE